LLSCLFVCMLERRKLIRTGGVDACLAMDRFACGKDHSSTKR
jgi:hypothetical protein